MKPAACIIALFIGTAVKGQDTFSILALDTITHEVGAAGASCLDLFSIPGYSNDFICELFPDTGAVATQAAYTMGNQINTRYKIRQGDTPVQLISWLTANDVNATPQVRQYGAVGFVNGKPQTAAHTGTACMNYKNHITGRNYTIHGNILLGQQVLDSMEAGFLRQEGDLACKLMAAMRGARIVGADTRCAPNNSSSLFAFLKVMQPTDTFGNPSFLISLKTPAGAMIEPIDSLEIMFNAARNCAVDYTGIASKGPYNGGIAIYPNPAEDLVVIRPSNKALEMEIELVDAFGGIVTSHRTYGECKVSTSHLNPGIYFITIRQGQRRTVKKLLVK